MDQPAYFYASDLHTNLMLELIRNITTGEFTVAFQMKGLNPIRLAFGIRTMFRIRHFRGSYLDSPRSLLTQS